MLKTFGGFNKSSYLCIENDVYLKLLLLWYFLNIYREIKFYLTKN